MPAIILSLLSALVVAVDAWLLLGAGKSREFVLVVLAIQLLVMLAAIWTLAASLRRRVFRPLQRIRVYLRTILHADAEHRLDPLPGHGLGELPRLVEELGCRLSSERRESSRAIEAATARLERRRSFLEAILRDLHEGVIVCNDDHRIVLFNQAAAAFLEPAGPVGLDCPVSGLFRGTRLRKEYALLRWHHDRDAKCPLVAVFPGQTLDGRPLELRMSLIVDHGEIGIGYVVSFVPGPP
ncbi:MAG TPA: hypothetical protein VK973_05125 [Arenicellales bacterium]|nr:hypothetical protein [Arenicellales bacterium]